MNSQQWEQCDDPSRMIRLLLGEYTPRIGSSMQIGRTPTDRQLRLFAQSCAYFYMNHELDNVGGWGDWSDRKSKKNYDGHEFTTADAARYWAGVKVGQINGHVYKYQEDTATSCHMMREIMSNPLSPRLEWTNLSGNHKAVKSDRSILLDIDLRSPPVVNLCQLAYQTREKNLLDPLILLGVADELEDAMCPLQVDGYTVDQKGRCTRCQGTKLVLRETRSESNKWYPCSQCGGGVSPGLIEHLRSPGPHPYGCWVVEFLLSDHVEWQVNTI